MEVEGYVSMNKKANDNGIKVNKSGEDVFYSQKAKGNLIKDNETKDGVPREKEWW